MPQNRKISFIEEFQLFEMQQFLMFQIFDAHFFLFDTEKLDISYNLKIKNWGISNNQHVINSKNRP